MVIHARDSRRSVVGTDGKLRFVSTEDKALVTVVVDQRLRQALRVTAAARPDQPSLAGMMREAVEMVINRLCDGKAAPRRPKKPRHEDGFSIQARLERPLFDRLCRVAELHRVDRTDLMREGLEDMVAPNPQPGDEP